MSKGNLIEEYVDQTLIKQGKMNRKIIHRLSISNLIDRPQKSFAEGSSS